jgi:hypothetical protein
MKVRTQRIRTDPRIAHTIQTPDEHPASVHPIPATSNTVAHRSLTQALARSFPLPSVMSGNDTRRLRQPTRKEVAIKIGPILAKMAAQLVGEKFPKRASRNIPQGHNYGPHQ